MNGHMFLYLMLNPRSRLGEDSFPLHLYSLLFSSDHLKSPSNLIIYFHPHSSLLFGPSLLGWSPQVSPLGKRHHCPKHMSLFGSALFRSDLHLAPLSRSHIWQYSHVGSPLVPYRLAEPASVSPVSSFCSVLHFSVALPCLASILSLLLAPGYSAVTARRPGYRSALPWFPAGPGTPTAWAAVHPPSAPSGPDAPLK